MLSDSKNISVYAIFNDQSFNNTLTNDIVSFEQLGPGRNGRVVVISSGHNSGIYCIYPKYWDITTPYHTYPKI